MSDPVFDNGCTYVYFTCDRDPTSSEPIVNEQLLGDDWLFYWWNKVTQTLFWCQDQTADAQIWIKIPKISDIPAAPVASGDITLALGSGTVSLPALTDSQIIKLSYKTPGGTPGAVFVSSVTAGTGFKISSTSSSDESVIQWEVFN